MTARDKAYKVWAHVEFDSPNEYLNTCCHNPTGLNYRTGLRRRLYNKDTIVKWELVKRRWYANYEASTETYSDEILYVDFAYTRDTNWLAIQRTKVITRLYFDDTECPDKKTMIKYYTTPRAKEEEIQKRRKNLIHSVKGMGYWTPFESILADFTDSIKDMIERFILRWGSELRDYIVNLDGTDQQYAWIDQDLWGYTARQVILSELDI